MILHQKQKSKRNLRQRHRVRCPASQRRAHGGRSQRTSSPTTTTRRTARQKSTTRTLTVARKPVSGDLQKGCYKGMQYASPTSCHPCAQRTDVSTVVPELAHKPMHAPKNLDNIRNLVNIRKRNERRDTFFEIACASHSFMHAHTKLPKNDAGRVCVQ